MPLRNPKPDSYVPINPLASSFHALSDAGGLHVDAVRVVKDSTPNAIKQAISASKASSVLIASADYHLSNDAGSLWMIVHAAIYRSGTQPSDLGGDALYRNTFWFTINLPEATKVRDDNIAAWSANHGALLRTDLKRGAEKVAQLIAADTQASDAAPGKTSAADGALERKPDGTEQFVASN